MSNEIAVHTLASGFKSVDLATAKRFKQTSLSLFAVPVRGIDPYVAMTEDGTAIPIVTLIEQNLTGRRTQLAFYGGVVPRTGHVFHVADEGLWFIQATPHGFHTGEPHYFELEAWEATAWLTANGYEGPVPNAPAVDPVAPVEVEVKGKGPERPSKEEIECHRLSVGTNKIQKEIAKLVYGHEAYQPKVCRAIMKVDAWIEAGNVLPDMKHMQKRTLVVAPEKLEQGPPRNDGRRRDGDRGDNHDDD